MNLKVLTLSAATAALLTAASPMVSTSMSTDNGGTKLAIDAYSDGGGVLLINQASDSKFDNSAMNKLVFKYGDAAKSSNTTLKNQVNVLSPSATAIEKAAASSKLEFAKIAINPPVDGVSCSDNNPATTGDVWTAGVCAGTPAASCNAIKLASPAATDGAYTIDPDGVGGNAAYSAYCDMTTDGGGWTKCREVASGVGLPVDNMASCANVPKTLANTYLVKVGSLATFKIVHTNTTAYVNTPEIKTTTSCINFGGTYNMCGSTANVVFDTTNGAVSGNTSPGLATAWAMTGKGNNIHQGYSSFINNCNAIYYGKVGSTAGIYQYYSAYNDGNCGSVSVSQVGYGVAQWFVK